MFFFRLPPPTPEEQAEKVGQFIAEDGYLTAYSYAIDSIRETWRYDEQAVEISILAPTAPGHYPLIIYLPGLGEHADGDRLWRGLDSISKSDTLAQSWLSGKPSQWLKKPSSLKIK